VTRESLPSGTRINTGDLLEARVGIEPTHKGFADLSLTTWVPRLSLNIISKFASDRQRCSSPYCNLLRIPSNRSAVPFPYLKNSGQTHFFAGSSICASRKNRADSSGGVGLM
jgi:hypothetical protein